MKLNIFSIKKDLEAKVSALTTDNEKLVKELNDLKATIANQPKTISAEEFETLSKEKTEAVEQVSLLVKQLEDNEKKMKDFEALTSQKALEIVQSTGSPAVIIPDNTMSSGRDILGELNNIKGAEDQRKFFVKHEKEIRAALVKR
jgi:hypothetical protein